MKDVCKSGLLAILLAAGASLAQQERDWSAVEIATHPVAGNVHYLSGAGGNIGLSIGEDGIVMIDDQFAPLTDRILAAIRELDDGEIRFVINTHAHGDHTGGNENLGKAGVVILANDRVRVRMIEEMRPEGGFPVLTYSEAVTIHLNGDQVRVFTVPPAHTDGDSFIHFLNADVLHLGDVFRTTNFPYIDRDRGGTLQGTLDALAIAIGMSGPDTIIIPGHGTLSRRDDVVAFRDMTLDVAARVKALVAGGAAIDEVLAARPAADYEAKWGDPERFVRALYAETGGM